MAGTSNPVASAWPHGGDQGYIVWRASFDHLTGADTGGQVTFAIIKCPFDCRVKRAFFSCFTAGIANPHTDSKLQIVTDDGTPQTIVAARALTGSDDAGAAVELTVADEGPIPQGGEIAIQMDTGDANFTLKNGCVELWVRPEYA